MSENLVNDHPTLLSNTNTLSQLVPGSHVVFKYGRHHTMILLIGCVLIEEKESNQLIARATAQKVRKKRPKYPNNP